MKRLLKAAGALLCALGLAATAQAQLTTITASNISFGGVPIAAGTVTFTPVNSQGTAIAFAQGGGGLNAPAAFSCTITTGAIAEGCQIPDAALTTPANILYSIQIINTATQKSFTLQQVPNITGTTWPLDQYGPPAQTSNVQTVQTSYGTAAAPSPCVVPSIYIRNNAGGQMYTCIGGVPVLINSALSPSTITAALGYNPAAVPLVTSGATADYKFLEGSGTTITDSVNGYNGTFLSGGAAPTWTATGLSFVPLQGVTLPAQVNNSLTFMFAVYINPLTSGTQTANDYPVLMMSTLGNASTNFVTTALNEVGLNNLMSPYNPGILVSSMNTSCGVSASGFHVLTYETGISGTSNDQIFIDGVECPYGLQTATGLLQTSGNYILGSNGTSPFTTSGLLGTMYRLRMWPAHLSAAQVATSSAAILSEVASRGVAVTPPKMVQGVPTLHAIGDSITCAYNGAECGGFTPYASLISVSSLPTLNVVNWGIGNLTAAAAAGQELWRVAPRCQSSLGPDIATVFLGTNDWSKNFPAPTGFDVVESSLREIQVLKSAGCQVYAVTMLSRTGYDAQKDVYDAQLLSMAKTAGADGVIDAAANPLLGADGASANSTYWLGDGIHPTQLGQNLIAVAFSNSINYYYGYNKANPHVITGTSVTLGSGDGSVTAAPTGNAAYTMPDCTGPSGVDYVINNPQSTFTVTVTGGSGQPINGLTSAIAIPSNSTVTLHDVPNPKTTSGCHWAM